MTPDLFIAAVVALVITLALHQLEAYEGQRIADDATVAAVDGLSLDERIEVVGDSIHRSTRCYIPLLVAGGGAAVGLVCRLKRWAWVTTLLAITPALLTGASFYIDLPVRIGLLVLLYVLVAVAVAHFAVAVRHRVLSRVKARSGS